MSGGFLFYIPLEPTQTSHIMAPQKISEDQLQIHCVNWFRMQYARFVYCLFHPANGGSRNVVEASKFKRMGVVRGVADLFLSIPNTEHHGFYIELKVGTNDQTEDQKMFMRWARSMGYRYEVCRDVETFIDLISDYMKKTDWYKPTWRDGKSPELAQKQAAAAAQLPKSQSKWRKKH